VSRRSGPRPAVAAALAVGAIAVAVAALFAIPASQADGAGSSGRVAAGGDDGRPVSRTDGSTDAVGVDILRSEVEAMLASGMAPDDPKVAALQRDLASLERGTRIRQPGEPGLDMSRVLGAPRGRGARSVAVDEVTPRTSTAWDQGAVDCEPLPPNLLTAADVAGARCASVPQPDGSGRYVALAPDGTLRVVQFEPDGPVTREPDRHVDGIPPSLDGVSLGVDGSGRLVVTVEGAPGPTIVDLG